MNNKCISTVQRPLIFSRGLRRSVPSSVLFILFWCAALNAAEMLSRPRDADNYGEKILALLRVHCAKCHGPLNPKAGLNLTTLRGVARGGDSGAVISFPANLDESLLWERVQSDEMPPDAPLAADEKLLLQRWIEVGAPGLPVGEPGPIVGADHWAYQSLDSIELPSVRDPSRVRTDIDRYVQSRLEAHGLSLGPDADPFTLIRRASLDLTGLPPTPEEVAVFITDTAPDAYERMVDRYLASPRFGERWGKHWLDAVGYADSNGYFSADTNRPLAFRYRDYVIASLNADKPFDRFVCEQLAGDEMATFHPEESTNPETIELLIATHFLRNGQDGTDIGIQEPEAFEVDRRAALEAAVQITASSLLGLTLHCARCHDHKFEPITQQEYYQFQALLFPAFNPQDWVNPQDRIVYAHLPGDKEAWIENERRLTTELESLHKEFTGWLASNREPSETILFETFDDSWRARWSTTAPGDDSPGGSVAIDGVTANSARSTDGRLHVLTGSGDAWLSTATAFDWTPDAKGDWIQAMFDLVDVHQEGQAAENVAYLIAAHDFDDSSQSRDGDLLVDGNASGGATIRRNFPKGNRKSLGIIGKQSYVSGHSYGVRVTNMGPKRFLLEHFVDGLPDGKSLKLDQTDLPKGGFAFVYSAARNFVVDNVRIERSLPASDGRPEIATLRQQHLTKREDYERRRSNLEAQQAPHPGRAIAWVTDKSAQTPVVPFLVRGLYHERGPAVEPDALRILTDAGRGFVPQPRSGGLPTTGRRVGLAQWLTAAGGRPAALMARTHVNRIWQQYFGRGIVTTTDNLGLGGAPPSHPELLDRLAADFIENRWSQKSLHRRFVTSTVYRQSSAPRPEGLAADPGNVYLWRRPIRRLQAEVIRDSTLAVAGRLDAAPYGPYVPTRQDPVGEVVVDQNHVGCNRRSVYLQQRRSQTLSMLRVFDAPSLATICTSRASSTVPLQSLTLLNSDFIINCSEAFARRLSTETDGTPLSLIRRAWQIAIARSPTSTEESLSLKFLAAQREQYPDPEAAHSALTDFCQMLLASNAFLYLE